MPAEWLMTNVSMDSTLAGFHLGDEIRDRLVLGVEVQQDPDITELERAVDDDHLLAQLADGRDREVDGDGGLADAALRAEYRDDHAGFAGGPPVEVASTVGGGHREGSQAALLVALAGVDLADRRGELIAAERLDEELSGAGQHRPAEVVRLALHGHHDHRGRRGDGRHPLRRGDAIHVRHVDVHQDDVGVQLDRDLERIGAGPGRADHVDVALEAKQLREVIPGLRDVVDDEDADLVWHLALRVYGGLLRMDGSGSPGSRRSSGPGGSVRRRAGIVSRPTGCRPTVGLWLRGDGLDEFGR